MIPCSVVCGVCSCWELAGLELIELADGVTLDEVAAKTEAAYTVKPGVG